MFSIERFIIYFVVDSFKVINPDFLVKSGD
jgi:hypothetical protein